MNVEETVAGLVQELRRGTLILMVLTQLQMPMYGYALVKKLNESGIPMDANTLYPLMRRLESQGMLQSSWNTDEAKPRKYYEITPEGREVLEKTKDYYQKFTANVNAMLEGE